MPKKLCGRCGKKIEVLYEKQILEGKTRWVKRLEVCSRCKFGYDFFWEQKIFVAWEKTMLYKKAEKYY